MKRFCFISSNYHPSVIYHTKYILVYHQTITRYVRGRYRTYMYDYLYFHNDSDLYDEFKDLTDITRKRMLEIRSFIINNCNQKVKL